MALTAANNLPIGFLLRALRSSEFPSLEATTIRYADFDIKLRAVAGFAVANRAGKPTQKF